MEPGRQAIPTLPPDAFDTVRPSLNTRVDETGIPSTVKGWTTTAPSGWSIDDSAMPAGGVTEWRGWSFATGEFWTNIALGQQRETNVRARDVFAVADSDEWDDKAHDPGQFDSSLISRAFAVTGDVRQGPGSGSPPALRPLHVSAPGPALAGTVPCRPRLCRKRAAGSPTVASVIPGSRTSPSSVHS
ncbi:hypothetical protein [Streptomyces sp. NPDC093089]|uniref:hypothetical protein n=1 Tax=Streptomyces sp. NPDC093089 TaxID=3366024 RepID=UPI0037FA014B